MSRLQKKCFIGATSLHGLLLLALVVGPGFFTKSEMPSSPMIEIITDKATDAINPNPGTAGSSQPPPPAPRPVAVEQPQPQADPQPPAPKPVEQIKQTEIETPKDTRRNPESVEVVKDKPKRNEVKVSNKIVKLNSQRPQTNKRTNTADTDTRADAKATADRARLFARAGERIGSGISSSTDIKLDGPVGNGGAGLANYGQIVRRRYMDAWVAPTSLTDEEATVKISVTIARAGTILSTRIIDSSGNAVAAGSIQKILDRITTIGVPFPDGVKESQRTFTITFKLKAKNSIG